MVPLTLALTLTSSPSPNPNPNSNPNPDLTLTLTRTRCPYSRSMPPRLHRAGRSLRAGAALLPTATRPHLAACTEVFLRVCDMMAFFLQRCQIKGKRNAPQALGTRDGPHPSSPTPVCFPVRLFLRGFGTSYNKGNKYISERKPRDSHANSSAVLMRRGGPSFPPPPDRVISYNLLGRSLCARRSRRGVGQSGVGPDGVGTLGIVYSAV